MSQFVLLRHERADGCHWDLCLDRGEVLSTWQLWRDPAEWMANPSPPPLRVPRLPDHRRLYLDYEGPLSGGRGHVTRVDRGSCEYFDEQPGCWTVRLEGSLLKGTFRLEADADPASETWTLYRLRA